MDRGVMFPINREPLREPSPADPAPPRGDASVHAARTGRGHAPHDPPSGARDLLAVMRRGVAPRLLASVLLVSSVVTLALTMMQLYLDYRRSVDELQVRLEEIATAYLGGLAESLWQVDERQMAAQLRGLMSLPDIVAVELRETAGSRPVVMALGTPISERIVSRQFPVIRSLQGRDERIGTLRIDASLSFVYRELMERAVVILISQGAKTFVISLFILYIVHRLVTRHLHKIAAYVGRYRLARPPKSLDLERKPSRQPDELDQVVGAFNSLTRNLQAAYDELEERNRELQEDNSARVRAEEALRESELRLRDFAETASDWFWETGPDHRLIYASAGTPNHPFKGPSRIGKTRWEIATDGDEDPEKWRKHRQMLDNHEPFRGFVYKAEYKDGQPGFVSVSGRPVFDVSGRFLGYRGVASDVTGMLRSEEALRQSEQRYREIFDNTSDSFFLIDVTPDGRFRLAGLNRAGERITGLRAEDVVGQYMEDVAPKEIVDPALANFRRCIAAGTVIQYQEELHFPTGYNHFETMLVPVRDNSGRIYRIVGVGRPIDERITMEAAIRASEQRFRDYAETASDWLWETDADHRIVYTSAEGNYAFLGPSRVGQRRWEFAADINDEPEKWREHIAAMNRHEPFRDFVYRANRNDGNAGYVSISGKPIFDAAGNFTGYRGVGTDVTAAVRAEKALRKAKQREADHQAQKLKSEAERLDLLQRLINTQEMERLRIARELHDQTGQDLTGLSLGLKSLEASVEGQRGKAMLHWLQTLTAQIGANLHRTAGELRPTALDDVGLVRALETQVIDWAGRFGIHVDFHGSSAEGLELPQEVETTVYRIVQEALTNVLKHAAAKTVSLVLECHEGGLQIIVEDDGKGFDPDTPSATAGHLGLAGIRERLALVGGTLAIDSAPGVGTTLYIRIPLNREPNPPRDIT